METSRWKIADWKPGPLPPDLFRGVGGDLLILKAEESDAYTLVWVNANNRLCWIQDIPSWRSVPDQVVHVGEEISSYEVSINFILTPGTPDKTTVNGVLKLGGTGSGDGNAGTFTAEASGPPFPEGEGPG